MTTVRSQESMHWTFRLLFGLTFLVLLPITLVISLVGLVLNIPLRIGALVVDTPRVGRAIGVTWSMAITPVSQAQVLYSGDVDLNGMAPFLKHLDDG